MSKFLEAIEGLGLEDGKIKELATLYNEDVEGLKNNKDDILSQLTGLKTQLSELTNSGGDVNKMTANELIENISKIQQEKQELESKFNSVRKDAEQKTRSEMQKKLDELTNKNLELDKRDTQARLKSEFNKSLNGLNISEPLKEALFALHGSKFKVDTAEDGVKTFSVQDPKGENLSLGDFYKSWSETDEAKSFITNGNSGGGATGGNTGASTNDYSKAKTAKEKLDIVKNKLGR